jgi:hypothetical protein
MSPVNKKARLNRGGRPFSLLVRMRLEHRPSRVGMAVMMVMPRDERFHKLEV